MPVGENLKQLRKNSGLTQRALGEKLGLSQQAIADYEIGRNKIDAESLFEIAKVLHCDISDFFDPVEPTKAKVIRHNSRQAKLLRFFDTLDATHQRYVVDTAKAFHRYMEKRKRKLDQKS